MAASKPEDNAARLWLHGTWSEVKLGGERTEGRLAVLLEELPNGPGPPLHAHPEDETYVVLEGEVTFWVGTDPERDDGTPRGVGSVVFAAGGEPHTYRVESPRARVLVLSTPAGLEDYVRALGRPREDDPPPSRERSRAVARELGVSLLGPPPPARRDRHPPADTRSPGC